jgi:hypothetical protein
MPSEHLFVNDQSDLFEKSYEESLQEEKNKTDECLGLIFPNNEALHAYFPDKLCERLPDPEYRKIEGSLSTLSDPPCHTAYPKPFVKKLPMQKCGSMNNRKKNAIPQY